MANQTVIFRTRAISDLYFSSEAYDDFGPEHDDYTRPSLQMPDPRDWEIVEAIALEDFSQEDINRVSQHLMITDDQYEQLVIEGIIKPENLKTEKEKNEKKTEKILALATNLTYQMSDGKQRFVCPDEPETLFEALEPLLIDAEEMGDEPNMLIRLPIAGWHRTAFINPQALDYLMLPTHRLEQGRIDSKAKFLEENG